MSGIYIPGMEMPKKIEPALVIDFAEGIDGKRYARFYHYRYGGLTEWHEVIPVPDHGDLIARDAILNNKGVGTQIAGWGKMYHETVIEHAPLSFPQIRWKSEVFMRSNNVIVRFMMVFPGERPDGNGVYYERNAVETALKSMPTGVPIIDLKNDGEERIVGVTTSKPYDIQWDDAEQGFRFTVDGKVFYGGTSCVVNAIDADGKITDFSITSIGISE